MNWNDVEVFLAVARCGSVRAAGRALGVDHGAVSRRVRRLEADLGVKLLLRGRSGISLSHAGHELVGTARHVDEALGRVQRRLAQSGRTLAGRVHVSTHPLLAHTLLPWATARIREQHPQVTIELDVSEQPVLLEENEAEIAVRVAKRAPDDCIARSPCGLAYSVYASAAYLQEHDPAEHPEACSWIGWWSDEPYPAELRDETFPDVPLRGRCRGIATHVAGCEAGLGLAALPCLVADNAGLVRLSPPSIRARIFVLRHVEHRATIRVRAVAGELTRFLEERAGDLEGRPGP